MPKNAVVIKFSFSQISTLLLSLIFVPVETVHNIWKVPANICTLLRHFFSGNSHLYVKWYEVINPCEISFFPPFLSLSVKRQFVCCIPYFLDWFKNKQRRINFLRLNFKKKTRKGMLKMGNKILNVPCIPVVFSN